MKEVLSTLFSLNQIKGLFHDPSAIYGGLRISHFSIVENSFLFEKTSESDMVVHMLESHRKGSRQFAWSKEPDPIFLTQERSCRVSLKQDLQIDKGVDLKSIVTGISFSPIVLSLFS